MDQKQAKILIKNTFENAFDRERFIHFCRELLNHMEQDSFNYYGCYLPETYRPYIKSIERVGKYHDGNNRIDVLIIKLQKETSLIHARSMQRNFIAGYLQGKYGSTATKEAALVACVSPDPADWRFSLVKMDYDFKKTPTGNPKVVTEFSPARRWSFLVGENEQSHTAQSQLVKHMADDEQDPTLTQLEEAFNIETVTNEFFLEYRNLFIRTKEALDKVVKDNPDVKNEFDSKGVNTVDFAKKLLGQIVFLYFLQKKGWFGVGRDDAWGTGSKRFLRELFNKKHGTYSNFFNEILEPLFYEALRIDRSYDDDYYSRFNCKIPFLNGGLFDPIRNYDWVHIDINLPDSLFSNNEPTKYGDTGNGILDIFDRYNFTVREDEPLEKEVAIDPELLGKAYEKFNAIRPENFEEYKKVLKSGKKGSENKFNKQYGVYYTPREIVHYMCQQSLIHYLESELNGKTVSYERVGKPNLDMFGNEVRKGQLDITIEHKEMPTIPKEDIEKFIQLGEQFKENDEIALVKEEEIKNGNQKSSSIETFLSENICKYASIIDDKLENITICDPAVGSGAFPVGMMNEIVKARTVLNLYLKDDSRTTYNFKRQCIEKSLYGVDIDPGAVEIAKLRLWLSLIVEEEDFKNIKPLPNLDYKVVCGDSLIGVERTLFNEKLFEELENLKPFYFNETNPKNKDFYKRQIDDLISRLTNGNKDFDFEIYFSEIFHKKSGFDIVIANPPYIVFPSKNLRNFIWVKGNQNTYVAFLEIADKYINKKGIISYIIPSTWLAGNNYKNLREDLLRNQRIKQIIQLPYDIFEAAYVDNVLLMLTGDSIRNRFVRTFRFSIRVSIRQEKIIYQEFYPQEWINAPDSVIFLDHSLLKILHKYLKITSEQLGKIATVQRGTLPPKNIETVNIDKYDLGKFKIPWFTGQVYRYLITHGQMQYVDYRKLKENKPIEVFKESKILGRQLVSRQFRLQFTFTEGGFAFKKNLYAIYNCSSQFNYFYLLAILNSKLFSYIQVGLNTSGQRDDFPAFSLKDFRNFRIPYISPKNQNPFIRFVNKVLILTKDNNYLNNPTKQAKVKEYEDQIDQMIYQLYELNDDEIKIVENFYKKKKKSD